MKWFRLWTEIIDDPKLAKLSDLEFRHFISLLALASESESGGTIAMSEDDICWRLRIDPSELTTSKDKLIELKILENGGEQLRFLNWNDRQFESDHSTERVKRFRKKQVKRSSETEVKRFGNVSETPPEQIQNRTDTETEQRNQKTRARGQEKEKPPALPDWVNLKLWKDFKEHRKKLRKPMTAKAEALIINRLRRFKTQGYNPATILETSIERGWQSVYKPKEDDEGDDDGLTRFLHRHQKPESVVQ